MNRAGNLVDILCTLPDIEPGPGHRSGLVTGALTIVASGPSVGHRVVAWVGRGTVVAARLVTSYSGRFYVPADVVGLGKPTSQKVTVWSNG